MTIVKYRPKASYVSPFNTLVSEFFGRDMNSMFGLDEPRQALPSVNIIERDAEFKLEVMAPGYKKEDLKVNVEDNVLTVSAEKKNEEQKDGDRFTRREFHFSSFTRSFRLPESADADRIKAEYTDGILHLSIPKVEATKPKAKEIAVS
ncbi:MAG: Hsp20/alpha crystallin family protein [Flavobacteriales bacterium]|nr:Hsp20/alpha crystallin family protein [Flavobacteriales bacterium]